MCMQDAREKAHKVLCGAHDLETLQLLSSCQAFLTVQNLVILHLQRVQPPLQHVLRRQLACINKRVVFLISLSWEKRLRADMPSVSVNMAAPMHTAHMQSTYQPLHSVHGAAQAHMMKVWEATSICTHATKQQH